MTTAGPKNSLVRLQRMAATAECATIHWERAAGPTSRRLNIPWISAEEYILATVQQLTPDDYVHSLEQSSWCDVYACIRDNIVWYVKLAEDEHGLIVISHHEPEYGTITTASGRTINAPAVQPSNTRYGKFFQSMLGLWARYHAAYGHQRAKI